MLTLFFFTCEIHTNTAKFYIRGVDYQPGGSSAVSENSDPLSDPVTCARDILLFQDLNINVCAGNYTSNRIILTTL